jgi:hypothetical protein
MEKPCEICLKVVHPAPNQMKHRILCLACAKSIYQSMEDRFGIEDVENESEGDYWSFPDSRISEFANQVNETLSGTCPQCRKRH